MSLARGTRPADNSDVRYSKIADETTPPATILNLVRLELANAVGAARVDVVPYAMEADSTTASSVLVGVITRRTLSNSLVAVFPPLVSVQQIEV